LKKRWPVRKKKSGKGQSRNYFKEKRRGVCEKKGCTGKKSFVRQNNRREGKIIGYREIFIRAPKKSPVLRKKTGTVKNYAFF
jgi:hypothetical protein